ncbi:MAG: adenylate kinase [Chlamydiales bacterium]|nr:adenylate kinase [Chlamydiales bacterium]
MNTSDDRALVIVLLGPPGSGKGTQATKIAEACKIPHISTGDLFRYNIKNETPLGKKVKEILANGQLVPDTITLDMLFERLSLPDCQKGYLLDGVPRTVPQAETIQKYLQNQNHQLVVCNLHVSDQEVLKRITGRRSCPQCKTIYHIHFSPPKQDNICDTCNTSLIQRTDDTPEVVEERLKAYYNQTKPVADFYKQTATVHEINGEESSSQVFNALMGVIESYCPKA